MEWICAGSVFWIVLTIVGLLAAAGLVFLLIKLGVIFHYASKPKPTDESSDYALDESKESKAEGEPKSE
jgi:uncharacterized membrane protein